MRDDLDEVIRASGLTRRGQMYYEMYEKRFGRQSQQEKPMTFADVVSNKHLWIGGSLDTWESGKVFESEIIDIVIEDDCFVVVCDDNKNISVNMEYSSVSKTDDNNISFVIPYVGTVYLHKKG